MNVGEALVREVKRHLLEESWPKIVVAVRHLSEEELWHRVNSNTNSVGNLLLHLSGNVRQWIVSGLGGAPDERRRASEFEETGPIPAEDVLAGLEATLSDAAATLERLDPEVLLEERSIQGFQTSGVQALVHVVEHFSYHVGQITHIVKALKDVDLKYYSGKDLDRTNER